ncbi:MAG: M56 family metallopeptidase [Thermoguttaceae bacterium]
MHTEFLLTILRTTLLLAAAGGICELAFRQTGNRYPHIRRWCWLGVLLLGICFVQFPILIPLEKRAGNVAQRNFRVTNAEETFTPPSPQIFISYEPNFSPITDSMQSGYEEPALTESHEFSEFPDVQEYESNELPLASAEISTIPIPPTMPTTPMTPELAEVKPVSLLYESPEFLIDSKSPTKTTSNFRSFAFSADALLVVWLGGMVICVTFSAVKYFWFLLLLKYATTAEEPDAAMWHQLLTEHGIKPRTIPMLVSENLGPALVRTLRGYRLVVPRELWSELPEAGRRGILRHELEHFLRGDVWKSFAVRLLGLPHWFNPMTYLAFHRFDEAAEQLCDLEAFSEQAGGVAEFAEILLLLHENAPTQFVARQAFLGRNLPKRIACLLQKNQKEKVSIMKKITLTSVAVLVVAVSLLRIEFIPAETPANQETAQITEVKSDTAGKNTAAADESDSIKILFVDENDKPVPGVEGYAMTVGQVSGFGLNNKFTADENGIVRLKTYPDGYDIAILGYKNYECLQEKVQGDVKEAKIALRPGRVLEGQIVDDDNNPIKDVAIYVGYKKSANDEGGNWTALQERTNEKGDWKYTNIPKEAEIIVIYMLHNEYEPDRVRFDLRATANPDDNINFVWKLKKLPQDEIDKAKAKAASQNPGVFSFYGDDTKEVQFTFNTAAPESASSVDNTRVIAGIVTREAPPQPEPRIASNAPPAEPDIDYLKLLEARLKLAVRNHARMIEINKRSPVTIPQREFEASEMLVLEAEYAVKRYKKDMQKNNESQKLPVASPQYIAPPAEPDSDYKDLLNARYRIAAKEFDQLSKLNDQQPGTVSQTEINNAETAMHEAIYAMKRYEKDISSYYRSMEKEVKESKPDPAYVAILQQRLNIAELQYNGMLEHNKEKDEKKEEIGKLSKLDIETARLKVLEAEYDLKQYESDPSKKVENSSSIFR